MKDMCWTPVPRKKRAWVGMILACLFINIALQLAIYLVLQK